MKLKKLEQNKIRNIYTEIQQNRVCLCRNLLKKLKAFLTHLNYFNFFN